jgi:dihydroxyacetone kinase phosphoprotein-dependent L subunit
MTGDGAVLGAVLRSICDEVRRRQQYLCDLDAVVGDGDHGLTMVRCAQAIEGQLEEVPNQGVGEALERIGTAIARSAGGATGPLLGTAFVEAGRALDAAGAVDPHHIAAMLDAALQGIRSRGRANPGDRTMLDALHPAAASARRAAAAGSDVAGVVEAAALGADEGAQATATMVARAGRSVRMGERALGHLDPGAVSIAIMLRAASDRLSMLGTDR